MKGEVLATSVLNPRFLGMQHDRQQAWQCERSSACSILVAELDYTTSF